MANIIRQTTVARDGHHNAFTDLQYWQENYWVAYRKGAGHSSPDGTAMVAVSADRRRFRDVASLKMPGDCRDPKHLPLDDNRMACYFPSWTEYKTKKLQQYIAFSENGFDWDAPRPILETERWLWRIRPHDGKYYGLIQNLTGSWAEGNKPHELDLAVSDDLLNWEPIARIGGGLGLNESDIFFHSDGEAWIVSRTVKETEETGSYFAAARPPYTDWQVQPMRLMVHAPIMLEHDGNLYVAGRSTPIRDGDHSYAFGAERKGRSMALWRVRQGELELVMRLPATGDCSYPGMIKDPEGRICISYYSQHAYHHGVIQQPEGEAADVYFAELELS